MTTDSIEEADRADSSGTTPLAERSECQHTADVVAAIHEHGERVKGRELEEALGKLDARGELSDVQRDVVEGMVDAIVDRLLATPITSICRADDSSALDTAVRLFDLEVGVDGGETHEGGSYRLEVPNDDD